MKKEIVDEIIGTTVVTLLLVSLMLLATLAHCSTTESAKELGIPQVSYNPYSYIFGNPVKVDVFSNKGQYFTNVTFAPYGASLLNTVPILFCGNQTQVFKDTEMRIVAYRTKAKQLYQTVACHEVFKVVEVQLPKEER